MSITINGSAPERPRRPVPPVTELLAVAYLALGWATIPVKVRGKTPIVEWRTYQSRQPTPAEVREWFARWPDANVGIVTGAVPGLVVVDLDSLEAVQEFLRRWGKRPLSTPVVRTGRGVQVYFRHPGGSVPNRAGLLPDTDIRGDGGFVVVPGSVHESGHAYRFLVSPADAAAFNDDNDPLLPMPEWLHEMLNAPETTTTPTEGSPIPEGERNDALYRIARALKAKGLSEAAIRAAVQAENAARCCPPLPDAEVSALVEHALTQPDRRDFAEKATEHRGGTGATDDPIDEAVRGAFNTRWLSDVEPEEVSWLWPGYIPRGKLTLLIGDPGCGKSYLTLDLAARLTSGKPWPDGAPAQPRAQAVLLQAEDGVADTVRPRLDALGGDVSRVRVIESVRDRTGTERVFSLEMDLSGLKRLLATGLVGLLIIDPLTAYLGTRDSYKDADMRRLLAPLAMLAAETGVAVVAVMHLNKKQDQKALYRTGGSIAFVAAARVVLAVAKDPGDETRRLLVPVKANIAAPSSPLAFRVDADGLRWNGNVDVDLEQLLSTGRPETTRRAVKRDEASTFLRTQLADGPRAVADLQGAAAGAGLAWRTVERAKQQLGVVPVSRPGGGWLWTLPEEVVVADSAATANTLQDGGREVGDRYAMFDIACRVATDEEAA